MRESEQQQMHEKDRVTVCEVLLLERSFMTVIWLNVQPSKLLVLSGFWWEGPSCSWVGLLVAKIVRGAVRLVHHLGREMAS